MYLHKCIYVCMCICFTYLFTHILYIVFDLYIYIYFLHYVFLVSFIYIYYLFYILNILYSKYHMYIYISYIYMNNKRIHIFVFYIHILVFFQISCSFCWKTAVVLKSHCCGFFSNKLRWLRSWIWIILSNPSSEPRSFEPSNGRKWRCKHFRW